MARTRTIALTAGFLGLIFAPPVGQAIVELREGERPVIAELFAGAPAEAHLRQLEKSLDEASSLGSHLRPWYQVLKHRLTGDLGHKALRGREGWLFYQPDVKYLLEPYFRGQGPLPEGDPVAVIRDFKEQLASRGIDLLVVPVPGKPSVLPDRVSAALERTSEVNGNTRRFLSELREAGVETVDLQAAFRSRREAAGDDGALYLRTDTHWTGEGAVLAARRLAERVRRYSWYEGAAGERRYRTREASVMRRGDIVTMSGVPSAIETIPEELVRCRQVVDADGGLYRDLPESPVLLLGDSFSRIYQSDEPRAAGLIANLAYELQLPLASIVNDGGASTLVRQQLARRTQLLEGKRLVIWAFVERDVRFGLQGWKPVALWPEEPQPHDPTPAPGSPKLASP
ncbi:MAG: hypothetical protein HYZ28_00505 [Myxococcales bacterium]|nr:hypothetical protein [Myxococcales bacterium]